MKKLAFLIPLTLLLACGSYKTFSVARLQLGMTKGDVEQMSGAPKRILAVAQTEHGRQEILEYKTIHDEIYALEFMNDYLVRYEFLREEVIFVSPPPPVIVVHRPEPVVRREPSLPAPPPTIIRTDEQKEPAQENPQTTPPSRRPDSNTPNQSRPSESSSPVKSGDSDDSSQKPARRFRN